MTALRYIKDYIKTLIKNRTLPVPFFFYKSSTTSHDELFLLWHNGLGDSIVCNGLVRHLLKQGLFSKIHLPVRPDYRSSIAFMFSDISNLIELHTCNTFSESNLLAMEMKWKGNQLIDISSNNSDFSAKKWDQEFYRLANVPLDERWNAFKIPAMNTPLELPEKFIFVHDDPNRKLNIRIQSNLPIIRPKNIGHAFLWLPAIQNAEEIHCIDSSFFHIVESVKTKTDKLFFHNIRPIAYPASVFRRKWTVITPQSL